MSLRSASRVSVTRCAGSVTKPHRFGQAEAPRSRHLPYGAAALPSGWRRRRELEWRGRPDPLPRRPRGTDAAARADHRRRQRIHGRLGRPARGAAPPRRGDSAREQRRLRGREQPRRAGYGRLRLGRSTSTPTLSRSLAGSRLFSAPPPTSRTSTSSPPACSRPSRPPRSTAPATRSMPTASPGAATTARRLQASPSRARRPSRPAPPPRSTAATRSSRSAASTSGSSATSRTPTLRSAYGSPATGAFTCRTRSSTTSARRSRAP